jgi:DUF1365 family protein
VVSVHPAVPALYAGEIGHLRLAPRRHAFRYRASYWLVDVDTLPQRGGLARWCGQIRAADHVDVRRILEERGIAAARIVLLTGARTWGYVFNPLSVYWCYDHSDGLGAVVAEVHNTYGERHAYVLTPDQMGEATVEKAMYVSPFNAVDGVYRIRVSEPGETVHVSVTLERPGQEPFVATLRASRRPFTTSGLARSSLCHPAVRTRLLIQWQGLRLWARGMAVQAR